MANSMKQTSQRSLLFRQNVNRTEANGTGDRPLALTINWAAAGGGAGALEHRRRHRRQEAYGRHGDVRHEDEVLENVQSDSVRSI